MSHWKGIEALVVNWTSGYFTSQFISFPKSVPSHGFDPQLRHGTRVPLKKANHSMAAGVFWVLYKLWVMRPFNANANTKSFWDMHVLLYLHCATRQWNNIINNIYWLDNLIKVFSIFPVNLCICKFYPSLDSGNCDFGEGHMCHWAKYGSGADQFEWTVSRGEYHPVMLPTQKLL